MAVSKTQLIPEVGVVSPDKALVLFIMCYRHYVLLFSVIWNITSTANKVTTFSRQTLCQLENRLKLECAKSQQRDFKSLTECATECAKEDACLGISLDRNSSCYYHKECNQSFECQGADQTFTIFVKGNKKLFGETFKNHIASSCQNEGVWNEATNSCICSGGRVGTFCERHAKSCEELSHYGYPQGWPIGLIWVMLKIETYPKLIKVLCELEITYFNTYIMRNNGLDRQSSDPTTKDYIDGFYISDKYFWLGLTQMKALNEAGYTTVRLDTGFSTSSDWNLFQMTYNDFILGEQSTGFNFTFSTAKGYQAGPESGTRTYGDCLTPLKGAKFYAPDEKFDMDGKDCATKAGTGWWFKNCPISCNPLGYKTSFTFNISAPSTERIIMEGTDCENNDNCIVSMYFVTFQ